MTVRAHSEARRHGRRRFWADARRIAQHRGITLERAAKIVRNIDECVLAAASGEVSVARLVRDVAREVRR